MPKYVPAFIRGQYYVLKRKTEPGGFYVYVEYLTCPGADVDQIADVLNLADQKGWP